VSWQSGSSTDGPTLISDLFDLAEAAYRQGQAVARTDQPAAAAAHRASLAALGRILARVDPDGKTKPAELLIEPPAQREPGD